jgi:hypothetical protein
VVVHYVVARHEIENNVAVLADWDLLEQIEGGILGMWLVERCNQVQLHSLGFEGSL